MKITKRKAASDSYQLTYQIIEAQCQFGLKITEEYNDVQIKQASYFPLTDSAQVISQLLTFFSDNKVFILHASNILEDLNFTWDPEPLPTKNAL